MMIGLQASEPAATPRDEEAGFSLMEGLDKTRHFGRERERHDDFVVWREEKIRQTGDLTIWLAYKT